MTAPAHHPAIAYAISGIRDDDTTEDVKWKIEQAVRGCLGHVADPTLGAMTITPFAEVRHGRLERQFRIVWTPTAQGQ